MNRLWFNLSIGQENNGKAQSDRPSHLWEWVFCIEGHDWWRLQPNSKWETKRAGYSLSHLVNKFLTPLQQLTRVEWELQNWRKNEGWKREKEPNRQSSLFLFFLTIFLHFGIFWSFFFLSLAAKKGKVHDVSPSLTPSSVPYGQKVKNHASHVLSLIPLLFEVWSCGSSKLHRTRISIPSSSYALEHERQEEEPKRGNRETT